MPTFFYHFRGRIDRDSVGLKLRTAESDGGETESVRTLNAQAIRIARDIEGRIDAQFVELVRARVEIRFRPGSILFAGTVAVLVQNMGAIGGAWSFIEQLKNVIERAISSAVDSSAQSANLPAGSIARVTTLRLSPSGYLALLLPHKKLISWTLAIIAAVLLAALTIPLFSNSQTDPALTPSTAPSANRWHVSSYRRGNETVHVLVDLATGDTWTSRWTGTTMSWERTPFVSQ